MSLAAPDSGRLETFAEDVEAQQIYLAAKRRLVWRRRLLPILAVWPTRNAGAIDFENEPIWMTPPCWLIA